MYPTIDFIRKQTGEDLIINAGNEAKANAEIKQYTKTLLGELRKMNLLTNYNNIVQLIKDNENWKTAWWEAVASFIYEDYNTNVDKLEIAVNVIERDPLLSIKNVMVRK